MTDPQLLVEIEAQRALMIAVATGGPRIDDVNADYAERRIRLAPELTKRGLEDPNPFHDLWAWYGKWSSGDLPTYQSRRLYVSDLFRPLIQHLETPVSHRPRRPAEPTGWARVDQGLRSARAQLETARGEEQYQAVGLLCRETLISLAQSVFDAGKHPTMDGVVPSSTDAKRMLEAYIAVELGGGSNEAARKHARAALDLANDLQHRRTASLRDAAMCAEATTSVVNIIAIVAGVRGIKAETDTSSPATLINAPRGYELRLNQLRHQIGRSDDSGQDP